MRWLNNGEVSDEHGTVETPDGRLDLENDDKAPHWWGELTPAEQTTIATAYVAEHGGEQ